MAPERLKRRADFLNAAKGKRFHAKGFVLQAAPRQNETAPRATAAARFGVTVTKKIGGAVVRNRIRRRLKEAVRRLAPLPARPGHDYVMVARIEALTMAFSAMQADLVRALDRIDAGKTKKDTALQAMSPKKKPAKDPPPRVDSRRHQESGAENPGAGAVVATQSGTTRGKAREA